MRVRQSIKRPNQLICLVAAHHCYGFVHGVLESEPSDLPDPPTTHPVVWRDLLKARWRFMSAFLSGIRASGIEMTSWRGVNRAWYISFQDDLLAFRGGVRDWRGGYQGLGIWMIDMPIEIIA